MNLAVEKMLEWISVVLPWVSLLIVIMLMVLAATRQTFPGKGWLVGHFAVLAFTMLGFNAPYVLDRIEGFVFDLQTYYERFGIPLGIVQIIGFCLLIPFVISISGAVGKK